MNVPRILGFFAGAIAGGLIVFLCFSLVKKDKKKNFNYDERQNKARGKGYQIGFFTMFAYFILYGVLDICEIKIPAETFVIMLLGCILGVGAYAVYCIYNDAYVSLNENSNSLKLMFLAIGMLNILIFASNVMERGLLADGVVQMYITNLFVALLMFVVLIAMILREHKVELEELESEDEE